MSIYTDAIVTRVAKFGAEFLAKYPEQQAKIKELTIAYGWEDSPLEIKATADKKYEGRYAVTFWVGNKNTNVIKFTLDCYPACCALHQLNDFYVADDCVLEPFIKDFIRFCFDMYRQSVSMPRRLMINFVEWTRQELYTPARKDIPRIDKEEIIYPLMYKWAMSHDNIETLFVNHNTSRIIHNVIVNLE